MAMYLVELTATGTDKVEARISFRFPSTLIRGPSETGKSYIRDCLWYLLGGEKVPKKVPQAFGYDTLTLTLNAGDEQFELQRALAGGETRICLLGRDVAGETTRDQIDEDVAEFLVKRAGALGKQLLRSRSKRGLVTGGDLRHWFLLSQPNVISEEATSGVGTQAPQRSAAFHLFLTGNDDSGIALLKTQADVDRISGQLIGAEESLKRVRADLPSDQTREEIAGALERVDTALGAMTSQYDARASKLRLLREQSLEVAEALQTVQREADHAISILERFELLDKKYVSDSERLGATWEGISMFQALDETPCPLCGTPIELQINPRQLQHTGQENYRRALRAEIEKISDLRIGLRSATHREHLRVNALQTRVNELERTRSDVERLERAHLNETRVEFIGNPRTLAFRRSELSEQLSKFDDEARLLADIARLKASKKRKHVPLDRNVGNAGLAVADIARSLLNSWGFSSINSIALDTNACDLVIDGRARLDYGAGKRALFLAALTVALMLHALSKGNPHIGFVVIDSPLKSYADPKLAEQEDIPASTVTEKFYEWLATWQGPGQVVILENQEIAGPAKQRLTPIEFTGEGLNEGRQGFFP